MEIKLFIEIPWIIFSIISFLLLYFSNCSENLKNFSYLLFADCLIIGLFYFYKIFYLKQRKVLHLCIEFVLGLSFILIVTYNLYLNQNVQCFVHIMICFMYIVWYILRNIEIFYYEKKQNQIHYQEIV
jgi:hypothetical protein